MCKCYNIFCSIISQPFFSRENVMKTRQEKREENAMIAGYSFIIALLILLLLGCIKLLNTA